MVQEMDLPATWLDKHFACIGEGPTLVLRVCYGATYLLRHHLMLVLRMIVVSNGHLYCRCRRSGFGRAPEAFFFFNFMKRLSWQRHNVINLIFPWVTSLVGNTPKTLRAQSQDGNSQHQTQRMNYSRVKKPPEHS